MYDGPASAEVGLQLQLRQMQCLCKTGLQAPLCPGGFRGDGVLQNSIVGWDVVIHGDVLMNGAFKWKEPKNSCERLIAFPSFIVCQDLNCLLYYLHSVPSTVRHPVLLSPECSSNTHNIGKRNPLSSCGELLKCSSGWRTAEVCLWNQLLFTLKCCSLTPTFPSHTAGFFIWR